MANGDEGLVQSAAAYRRAR